MSPELHVPIPAGMSADQLDEAIDDIAHDAATGNPSANQFMRDLKRHHDKRGSDYS